MSESDPRPDDDLDAGVDVLLREALDKDPDLMLTRRLVTQALRAQPQPRDRPTSLQSGPLATFAAATCSLLLAAVVALSVTRTDMPHVRPESTLRNVTNPASLRISNEDGFVAVTTIEGARWIVLTGGPT